MKKRQPKNDLKIANSLTEGLIADVGDEIKLSKRYLLLLLSSALIATLGLLTNSAAVVIGAMLISPLFWPLLGISLSMVSGTKHFGRTSMMNLALSVVLVLIVSYLVGFVYPIKEVTGEIWVRAHPNLLDLLVALAASVIGVLGLYYPKISQSATGVAISLALLPAVCVAGIGAAFGSWEIFSGSFLLFWANTGAIVFSGMLVLYLIEFGKARRKDEKRLRFGLIGSLGLLFLLSVPLWLYLKESLIETEIRKVVNEKLDLGVMEISSSASIEELKVGFVAGGNQVEVEATVFLPEGVFVTQTQQQEIVSLLSRSIARSVDLKLNLVTSLLLRQDEDETVSKTRSEVEGVVEKWLDKNGLAGLEESVLVNIENSEELAISVIVGLKQFGRERPVGFDKKQELEKEIEGRFGGNVELVVELIPVNLLVEEKESTKIEQAVRDLMDDYFLDKEGLELGQIELVEKIDNKEKHMGWKVITWVEILDGVEVESLGLGEVEDKLSIEFGEEFEIEVRVRKYTNLE